MKTFGTRGPVTPERHYVVPRTREIADFIHRVKDGRYVVIFAPRQTGKTTFFRAALKKLTLEEPSYCPIELNFNSKRDDDSELRYPCVARTPIRQPRSAVISVGGTSLSRYYTHRTRERSPTARGY